MRNRDREGLIIVSDPGADKPLSETKTVQCVHCDGHFVVDLRRAEGRGWCMNCCGYVCGRECAKCVPVEQLLDNIEKGREPDFKPVVVNVPRMWSSPK